MLYDRSKPEHETQEGPGFRNPEEPPAKTPRISRECAICVDDKPLSEFPGQITKRCAHSRDICRSCVARTVDLEVNGKGNSTRVLCPHSGCPAELEYDDIRREAASSVFERYDQLLLRQVLQNEKAFRWCAHPGCGNGQIIERTCQQYESDGRASEEVALLQYFEREGVKRCPKCGHAIEKDGGCDHMTCRQEVGGCGAEFCIRCLADYNGPSGIRSVGNSAHRTSCPWYFPDGGSDAEAGEEDAGQEEDEGGEGDEGNEESREDQGRHSLSTIVISEIGRAHV